VGVGEDGRGGVNARPPAPLLPFLLRLALAAAALAGLAHVVEAEALARAARAAHAGWALAALALLPLNVGLEGYRFHRLVRAAGGAVGFGETLAAVVGAYPLGLLTPGRVGDYAGRALYLRALPPATTAALTFAERTATLWACLAAGAAALPLWLARPATAAGWTWAWAGALAAAAALGALLLHPRTARRLLGAALPFRRLRPALDALGAVPPREARVLLALSALRYVVFATQFVLLVRAFAPGAAWGAAGWGAAAAGVALVFFAKSAVPAVTLGDLGVREGAAVYFLGALGVAPAAAFNASLGLFAINLLLPALAGLPLVARLRLEGPRAPAAPAPYATDRPAPVRAATRTGRPSPPHP
jgi:uncharacterized membrane protein YbhN (UPF0104 family)